MSGRMRIETTLKVRPVTKLELRAQSAAEFVVNLGGDETSGDIASRGIMRHAWKEIEVNGVDSSGRVRDQAVYAIDWSGDHLSTVMVENNDGKSMLERTDLAIAELVRRQAERFQRKGLTIKVRFIWADGIDAERQATLRKELDTVPAEDLEWRGKPVTVACLRPAKDPTSSFRLLWGRK